VPSYQAKVANATEKHEPPPVDYFADDAPNTCVTPAPPTCVTPPPDTHVSHPPQNAGKCDTLTHTDTHDTQDTQRYPTTPNGSAGFASETGLFSNSKYAAFFKEHRHLNLRDYTEAVVDWAREQAEARAGDYSQWQTPTFDVVYLLRGHDGYRPHLENPQAALKLFDSIIRKFNADVDTPWEQWLEVDEDEGKADFVDQWCHCRYMVGDSPLAVAIDAARRVRLKLADDVHAARVCDTEHESAKDYEFFISVVGYLQTAMGNRSISISCRFFGQALGVSRQTISRYRRWALEDRYIRCTKRFSFHSSRPANQNTADEFRFDVSRFKCLDTKAANGTADAFKEGGAP